MIRIEIIRVELIFVRAIVKYKGKGVLEYVCGSLNLLSLYPISRKETIISFSFSFKTCLFYFQTI